MLLALLGCPSRVQEDPSPSLPELGSVRPHSRLQPWSKSPLSPRPTPETDVIKSLEEALSCPQLLASSSQRLDFNSAGPSDNGLTHPLLPEPAGILQVLQFLLFSRFLSSIAPLRVGVLLQFLTPAVGAGQSLPLGALPHPSFPSSSPTINNHAKLVNWKLLQLVNNLSTATSSVLGSHTGEAELCLGCRRVCSHHSAEKAPLCPRINKIITETLPCSSQLHVLPNDYSKTRYYED